LSQVFVVVPSDQCSSLENVFRRAGRQMPSGVPAGCAVQKVCICADSGDWTVHICAPADVDPGCAEAIQRAIADAAGVDGCVRLVFSGREIDPVPEPSAFEAAWPSVRERIARENPALWIWLAQARCRARGDEVLLEVPSDVQRDKLLERGCVQVVAAAFACTCQSDPPRVSIEIGEFEEPEEPEVTPAEEAEEAACLQARVNVPSRDADAAKGAGGDGSAAGDGEVPERRRRRRARKPDPGAIRGRMFTVAPQPISSLGEADRKVVCAGEVFGVERRSTKSGCTILTFNITDRTDSVACKCFCDPDDPLLDLKDGTWVAIRGDMQYDQYAREPVLSVQDVVPYSPPQRADNAPVKRVELHLHTKMSAMDSVCDVEAAVRRAALWGHPAIAITDHGVVQSFPEAYSAGKKHGVKVVYGIEGYLADSAVDDAPTYHVTILAMNREGLQALYRLVSWSHLNHFYRHPRILRSELVAARQHLLIGSACAAGEVYRAVLQGADDAELSRIASFYDYLEIMPPRNDEFLVRSGKLGSLQDIERIIARIYRIGSQLGIPVVATGDVHFLDPADEVYRRILMAKQDYVDADKQAPLYFRTTDEMMEEFAFLGEEACNEVVLVNPLRVCDMVEQLCPVPKELAIPRIDGAEEAVRSNAYARARELYGDPLPEVVRARLEKELEAIIGNGYAVNYDIAARLVHKSVSDGYPVGSRGSVGSSLVATMCGITEVNPLPPHYRCPKCRFSLFDHGIAVESGYDLPDAACPDCGADMVKDGQSIPFETFMGFDGDKVPDIDLNFSGEYQSTIHKYAEELFGADHVFRAGTIATIAEKTAFGYVKLYAEKRGLTLRHAEQLRLARGCSGVKRTTGQHPGGLMIVPKGRDVHEFTPIQRPANDKGSDVVTTHFEYRTIHDCLLKLDLLGHDDPTAIKMLEDLTGLPSKNIPMDDPATMALFSGPESLGLDTSSGFTVGTVGIPEFGTRFVRGMLEETRPTTFGELIRISGLSHGTDVWLNNAQDLIRSGKARLGQVIACRDDIMNALIGWGLAPSDAFRIMERVRKGKGLTEDDARLMREHAVPEWYLDSCNKIKYMFPKAHAAAYVMMAFRIAYYKVHHPVQFYAVYFSIRASDFDPRIAFMSAQELLAASQSADEKPDASARDRELATIYEVAAEAVLRGIGILPVDIVRSEARAFAVEGPAIRTPLAAVPGLGVAAAESVVEARQERAFTSKQDLRDRTRLTRSQVDALAEMGAIGDLPDTDQLSLF
jgi:DNA polymerase-3 subunit alpha (Gram-positive type)